MKKKVVSLLAAMALTVSALAGCGASADSTASTEAANTETTVSGDTQTGDTATTTTDAAATAGLKAGFMLSPEDGSYKVKFGEEEFIAYFREFLRPQIQKLLF